MCPSKRVQSNALKPRQCIGLAQPARDAWAIRWPASARTESFLQRANVRHEGFYLVFGKGATERLHFFFAVLVLHPFFDLFEHLLVGEGRLVFGVGEVFGIGFFARFGVAFSLFSMTGGAVLGPVFLDDGRASEA